MWHIHHDAFYKYVRSLLVANLFSPVTTMIDAQRMERNHYTHIAHEDFIEANHSPRASFADPLLADNISAHETSKRSQLYRVTSSPIWFFGCIALATVLIVQNLSETATGHAFLRQDDANKKPTSYENGFENELGE
jgi:hypothetical protein